jgi:PBP1b-binding outer membrane lipoprotein LpoB
LFLLFQEIKTMKKLFALTLLVAAMAAIGCSAEKKPATKPAVNPAPPATTPADKPAETPPAK